MTQKNNEIVKWLGVIITIIVLTVGGIKTASVLAYRVEENALLDKEKHAELEQCARENRENILKMQAKIDYIVLGIDDIKKKVDNK
jgi:hypothetical protein